MNSIEMKMTPGRRTRLRSPIVGAPGASVSSAHYVRDGQHPWRRRCAELDDRVVGEEVAPGSRTVRDAAERLAE